MRNYENEAEWQRKKYDSIRAYIDKDLGYKLREKLKKENKTIASWITESAREYLGIGNTKKY